MRRLVCLGLAAFFIFLSGTGFAAEGKTTLLEAPLEAAGELVHGVFDLGTILVGGKRLGSPFRDFVASHLSSNDILLRQDIELSGARNLPQAMEEVPGVVITDFSGNGEEPTLDFRGFNEGQDFIFTLDGVRLNEPKSNNINFPLIPVYMAERLEISRGGASFLYGEGAVGGVGNLVTAFPIEPGFHSRLQSLAGSFGEWGESFETSARGKDHGIYVTGDVYHQRGFRQNSSVEKGNFYTKWLWDPTDAARLEVSYLYADAHLDRSGSIRETSLNQRGPEATERPRNFADLDADLVTAQYTVKPVDVLTLSQNVFFRQSRELSVANFATFERDDNELDLVTDSWGTTFQANFAKGIFWNLNEDILFGVEYADDRIDEEDFNRSKATLRRLGTTVDSESGKEAVGVFSKLAFDWNERLGAYFGLRYDDIQFENTDRINLNNNIPNEVEKFSYSTGSSYKLTDHLALSATYSHSFHAPTLSDLYANPLFGGNPSLKPEESSNYELGVKWQKENHLLKSGIFLNRRTNEIGFDPNLTDGTHLFGQNNNFGKTQRGGVETLLKSRLRPWLQTRVSHTYTEAVFSSNTADGTQISGAHIPMVPRNRWAVGLLFEPTPDWEVDLNMLALSKQVLTNDITNQRNGRRLPAYTVFNLKSLYRWRGWELALEARNLFDESYETAGSLGAAPSSFNADHTVEDNFFVPAPGRSYRGSVSYSW